MDLTPTRSLVWFSCGAASAVAAKLAVEKYGSRCEVVYCDTLSTEHQDNARFFADVQRWLGVTIRLIRSDKYTSVDDVFQRARYMSGRDGARCTTEMKKLPRLAFEREDDSHIFGYTADEEKRAADFEKHNPTVFVEHILIDQGVTKADCLRRLADAGIALPAMYALGFDHNNCLACVKATSPTYWNLTRKHFPEAFARRAAQSEALGVRLARVSRTVGETLPQALPEYRKGKNGRRVASYRVFLSVLPSDLDEGGQENIECGPVCQTPGAREV